MAQAAPQEKIFAIGDIHGCYRNLVQLMDRLPFDGQRDTLVFVGDYINRGPQSREVIDYLLNLQSRCRRCIFLVGNHEHLLLSYAATGDVEILRHMRGMGVEATLKSYNNAPVRSLLDLSFLPAEHLRFLQALELSFRSGPYLFVHADADDPDASGRQLDQILTSRRLIKACASQDGCIRIFGHTAFETPLVTPDRIGIDTGAAQGNMLTALELPRLCFHHA
jgi:serine/threonine protein phosphatase 1